MEFDCAKENIQPLVQGRNASILQASLRAESPQELLARRKELEKEIHCYSGDDPLSVWYNYIEWIEQSFPSGGKESGLQEVLSKCLVCFENDERYTQDRRMIKLYIKFIDGNKDPAECYQQLFNAGIGTMVADFYIAWAYCYDLIGNTRKADEIFQRGISCRAQPLEELQEARQHFGFSVAQRLMYKDDDHIREETNRQLHERRMALTLLRGHRRKQIVGSIRTGTAVKNVSPGTVKIDLPSTSTQRGNIPAQIFKDEKENPNVSTTASLNSTLANEVGKSVVRSIIDAARNQENQKEPGPWNKAHSGRKGKLFGKSTATNELGFEIHEDGHNVIKDIKKSCIPPIPVADDETKFDKPFIYPANFCSKSKLIKGWLTPVTIEEMPDKNTIPEYNKCKLYPRPNMEFQPEELKAYNILKQRGIQNDFTKERDIYWGCGPNYNIRLYPHFATQSKPQEIDSLDQTYIPVKVPGLQVAFDEIYNIEDNIERQFEEILALRIKRNETIIKTTDMEETMCITSEKIQRRKSFFPIRKSLALPTFGESNKMAFIADIDEKVSKITMNELPSCSSANSFIAHLGGDDFKKKDPILNKNSQQPETPQTLELETTGAKTILLASEHTINHEKSPKLYLQNQCQNKLQSNDASEKLVPGAVLPKSFPIFVDDTEEENKLFKTPPTTAESAVPEGKDIQFKMPALPIANSSLVTAVSSILPFEIYDDEKFVQKSPNLIPNPDLSCGNGGFFDPEETCSTQTFNIFLKAQSVSTPNAVPKLQSQRQYGNILKEVTSPAVSEQKDYNLTSHAENLAEAGTAATVAADSPPRQQLSTILETSEHGSTQGTHTTGATTKSTLSSPDFDIESHVQTTTSTGSNQPHTTVLQTVKELTCENFVSANEMINRNETNDSEKNVETLRTIKLRHKCAGSVLNFSIFEDSIQKDRKQVGNFSRLEEKEDTATGSVFKGLPAIRFQDDKTETIPKILITSQLDKFQDDKTDTISKMMFEPPIPIPIQYQEDKTETISKFLLDPPQPIKFSEGKIETISKYMLSPPEPEKFENEKTELILTSKEREHHQENMNQADSFEFFGQTPPKPVKRLVTKQMEHGLDSHIRTAPDSRTPSTFEHKRFCSKDTPDIQKTKSLSKPSALFEDELQPNMETNCTTSTKNILKDSSLPNFLLVEESQSKLKSKSKSVFRDSFIPDFSIIEDHKPQTKQILFDNEHKIINEYVVPQFSLVQNVQPQPKSGKPTQKKSQNLSKSEFCHVPEMQPNEDIDKSLQSIEHISSSAQKIYTKTDILEKKANRNRKGEQSCKSITVSNETQEGTSIKNIIMDTFMKDFSEINESSPTSDIKNDKTIVQPNKNNSLPFLNKSLKKNTGLLRNSHENNSEIKNISSSKETKLNFPTSKAPSYTSFSNERKSSVASNDDKYFEFNCETEMFGTNISMIRNSTWLPNHGPSFLGNANQLSHIREKSLHIKSEDVSSNSRESCPTLKDQQLVFLRPEDSKKSSQNFVDSALFNDGYSIEISESEIAAINDKRLPNSMDTSIPISNFPGQNDDDGYENSIYYKQTPKTPNLQLHIWDDADAYKTSGQNNYIHAEPDFDRTHQVIENICIDPNVNPFNVDLINAFLEQNDVISFLESLPTCKLVAAIQRIKRYETIDINGIAFNVNKLIGEGSYGAVFCGKEATTGKLVAMKQEKPPNFWEYYICLEVQERIRTDEMLQAYMSVDYALIGNNSSILISNFSEYGSLIAVCNKVKKNTLKNVDEYVVMLLASELLEIIDHLHAVNIIHADVKADNFLLMKKLTYPATERHLQLIDFGVSIDMKLFKQGQTFSFVHNDNSFKCPEMRERRPWTYQLDLYGLAGVFHVLLFGKYMEIEKERGFWMHKTHIPRYINKDLWHEIFKTLLNVRDCNSMPNLQDLRALLKKEMEERDKYVLKMVDEFNRALSI